MIHMVLKKFKKQAAVNDDEYIVAIDIGTEFVKAMIARLEGEDLNTVGVARVRQ